MDGCSATPVKDDTIPETAASSRAREILNSMKARREDFSKIVRHQPPDASARPNVPLSKDYGSSASSVAQKLMRESLKDRRQRLARVSHSNDNLKILRFSAPSPSVSEYSSQTAATEESTTSSLELDQFPITPSSEKPSSLAEIQEALDTSREERHHEDGDHSTIKNGSVQSSVSEFGSLNDMPLTPVREEDDGSQAPIPKVISSHALNHNPVGTFARPSIIVSLTNSGDRPERESRFVTLPELVDCPPSVMTEASMRSVTPTGESDMGNESSDDFLTTTPEERASYVGSLYQASPETSPISLTYWKQRHMHGRVLQSTVKTKELLDVVVVDDHDARRKLLKALQSDVRNIHAAYVELETAAVTLPDLYHSCVSDDESSEASSCALTSDSDTSGWISSGESVGSNSASPPIPPDESLLNIYLGDLDDDASADISLLSAVMIVPTEEEKEKNILAESVLFVEHRTAEQLRLGGLYGVALASGWDNKTPIRIQAIPETASKPSGVNSDLCCGTRGSLYDLCLKSGTKIEVMPSDEDASKQSHPSWKYRGQGGMYDLAMKSGLAEVDMNGKRALEISTIPTKTGRGRQSYLKPESLTDRECGAWGSLATFNA